DPIGFLDHAEKQIQSSLNALMASQSEIQTNVSALITKRDENQNKVDTATRLSDEFKVAYKQAETDNSWPVNVADAKYTKDELIKQVETLIAQKQSYSSLIESQNAALDKASTAQATLKDQITKLKGELQSIATKRDTVKIDQLTAESTKWLEKVNEQVNASNNLANMGKDPVRDLDTFVKIDAEKKQKEAEAAAEAAKKQKTLEFLEG
ncbi:MAG TPA: hypothetical protein P5218_09680, partial [Planctomycetota bacterium]|nr:hypothetical protein [Planctomycetota bacterium]